MKHVIAGIALVSLGILGMIAWWSSFAMVMRGFIPFGLLALGLVALLSGYHRIGEPRPVPDEGHARTTTVPTEGSQLPT